MTDDTTNDDTLEPATTEDVVASMMVENTGTHILDSGGAYGRSWQRAQAALKLTGETPRQMFDAQPAGHWEVWQEDDFYPSVSTYHFLIGALDYEPRHDAQFHHWAMRESVADFADRLRKMGCTVEETGDNSYNHEEVIDQTIQWERLVVNADWDHDALRIWDGTWVFVQVHGGADVRGGYTAPRVFSEKDDWAVAYTGEVNAWCDGEVLTGPSVGQMDLDGGTAHYEPCHTWWSSSDAGCNWETGDNQGNDAYGKAADVGLVADVESKTVRCAKCGGEVHVGPREG